MSEAAGAFRQLVADPAASPPLDEGALLIAACGTGADVDAGLARLDDLAAVAHDAIARAGGVGSVDLAHHLFVDAGFAGNVADYADPRNSFLPDVIDRRLGLPITLSVLMIEVGRRIGIGLHGVGMPGHFLVGVDGDADHFVDPFHGGASLDRDGCRARFAAVQGTDAGFRVEFLAPTPSRSILLRMLTNLEQTYAARRSAAVAWVVRLRLAFPELPTGERSRAADVLASAGASDDAARVLEELLEHAADPATRDALGRRALAFRARSN